MRDVSPPSGLPRDGHDDAPGGNGARPRRDVGPRHSTPEPAIAPDAEDADEGDTPMRRDERRAGSGVGRMVLEWVAVIGCGVLIALTAQAFLVQAFWIPSPSMTPTLDVGDRVLVNKLAYKAHDVRRGDLVVFERPPAASSGTDGEIKDLIKRVVAVGGDTIEGHDGDVYVNGERIDEPYLEPGTPTDNLARREIPEGQVFVMGDNRSNSEDSRVFGPVEESTIVGRAVVKVLPLSAVGWL